MFTLTPSLISGSHPFGRSPSAFQGVRILKSSPPLMKAFLHPLEPPVEFFGLLHFGLPFQPIVRAALLARERRFTAEHA